MKRLKLIFLISALAATSGCNRRTVPILPDAPLGVYEAVFRAASVSPAELKDGRISGSKFKGAYILNCTPPSDELLASLNGSTPTFHSGALVGPEPNTRIQITNIFKTGEGVYGVGAIVSTPEETQPIDFIVRRIGTKWTAEPPRMGGPMEMKEFRKLFR